MKNEKISMKVIGAIVATGIMSFCGVLGETAMNVAFPTFIQEFQISTALVQWLTTIYLLVLSIVVPISGFLKHRFKNKILFVASVLLFTAGVIIASWSHSFELLLLGRAVQGIGTGIALPLMFNIIMEQTPVSKLGMMMGVGTMIPAIAPAIGPIFGGIVITQWGWRYIFILLIPVLLIAFVLGLSTIEQKSETRNETLDLLGLFMIAIMFTGLIFGFSNVGSQSFISLQVGGAFFLSFLGMLGLIIASKRTESPLLRLELLKEHKFLIHVLSFFIIQLVLMGLVFILPNYIQIVNGESPQISGFVVFPGAALGALMTPVGGKLLDKFGPKKPILIGSIILLISLLVYWMLVPNLSNILVGVLYFIFTLGISLSFGNLMTNGLHQLRETMQPDGNAIIMTFQQVAGAMGTAIVASIISLYQNSGEYDFVAGTINGSQIGLVFLIALTLIELLLVLSVFRNAKS